MMDNFDIYEAASNYNNEMEKYAEEFGADDDEDNDDNDDNK